MCGVTSMILKVMFAMQIIFSRFVSTLNCQMQNKHVDPSVPVVATRKVSGFYL